MSSAPPGAGLSLPAAPIGNATMAPDGTITLDLRANDNGMRGMARFVYPSSHPQYRMIFDHLGGICPGEQKLVPPFSPP